MGTSPDGKKLFRHTVDLRGEECPPAGPECWMARMRLLREFVDNPELAACGPVPYEKLSMYRGDGAWAIHLEAVHEEVA